MRERNRRPRRPAAAGPLLARHAEFPSRASASQGTDGRIGLLRLVRVIRRGVAVLLWTLACMPVQALCLLLPGRAKVVFARCYWSVATRLIGLQVRVIGATASAVSGRPVVFVSNHSSWLDVPVLGGQARCVLRSERRGRALAVHRYHRQAGAHRLRVPPASRDRTGTRHDCATGWPPGITCCCSPREPPRMDPACCRSAAPSSPLPRATEPPLIQPVSVVYDRLGGLPTGRASRPVFAWYGDMDLASHFWRLAQYRGLRVSILLHSPIDPSGFASRKALSHAVWQTVANGASTLRQNRPAASPEPAADVVAEPAYA